MYRAVTATLSFASLVLGQQVGKEVAEKHPTMPMKMCTAPGSCTTESTSVVLDVRPPLPPTPISCSDASQSNWRWTHVTNGYANCYGGDGWNATNCADNVSCAKNCAIDGANYAATYGITTPSSGALRLNFVTKNDNGQNVGSRVYLLASDTKYRTFNLLNKEFTFTVDVSKLSCGLNGAVYFSEMDADVCFRLFNLAQANRY